jgi:DNA-binding SARP family transcriptional activator
MSPPSIILFGGSLDQQEAIKNIIPAQSNIACYPLQHPLVPAEVEEGSFVFLILKNSPKEQAEKQLVYLKKKFPGLSVIMIEKAPTHHDIIKAFRLGAADFLEWPLQPEEFRRILLDKSTVCHFQDGKASSLFHSIPRKLAKWFHLPHKQSDPLKVMKKIKWTGILSRHQISPPPPIQSVNPNEAINCRFLGPFSVKVYGEKLKLPNGKKTMGLLAYLLYHHNKPIHREILMSTFWPHSCSESARNSLNTALYNIRKTLQSVQEKPDLLLYKNECYYINPALKVVTDADQFIAHLNKGRHLDLSKGLENSVEEYNHAVELYVNDFLEELRYEDWCDPIRDNLRESYLLALNRLSYFFFESELYSIAINLCQKILIIDPYLEEVHQRLIICYYKTGARDKAIRQYQKCKSVLNEELQINPSEQTTSLFQEIMGSSHDKVF